PSVLLGLTVWLIYAADRMLDALRGRERQPRHEFYRRYWRAVLPVWSAALALGAWMAWTQLSPDLFMRGALLASCTLLYLAAVHLAPGRWKSAGRKEAAVAVLFALGATLAAWPEVETAYDIVSILLFSGLCWMNCTAIEDWEHGREARTYIVVAAVLVAVTAAILLREHRPVLGSAETASALGLVALDRLRGRISPEALRVLADGVLLTPVLFLRASGMFV
ncbi:MAG: hypothetical protein ACRD5L_03175, partial [Bryobacteraceae bacterium]